MYPSSVIALFAMLVVSVVDHTTLRADDTAQQSVEVRILHVNTMVYQAV